MAEQIKVELPGPGETAIYRLEAGVPVRFGFDLSEADFAASGDDLVITLPGGGTVVLAGYLPLAGEDALPVFEMLDGQLVPGGVYLFAFGREGEAETAAGDAPDGSGAGNYADNPGLLGTGLDALDGQTSLFTAATRTESLSSTPVEDEALPAQDEVTIFPETTSVQIVLNPGFEASGYAGDRWSYLDDVDHWRNTGGSVAPDSPPSRGMMLMNSMAMVPAQKGSMKTWGADMDQKPQEGDRFMELDARSGSVDALSQTIATKAGEAVTIVFNFTPRVADMAERTGMDTNDFQVSLGDQLVATITWDATHGDGAWLVTLGEGVTSADGVTGSFHFTNWGYAEGTVPSVTEWTELGFTLTAGQDHAALTFSELHNDGYGTLIDSVTAYRDFDTLTVGGESDDFHQAEFLAGTDGDDAIFGSAHTVVDGLDDIYSYAEVIDGGAGDDALYGGQNFLTVISGGAGDDFIVAGRPLYQGLEESHATDEPVGQSYILPGSGNDFVRLGEGADSIILNREALVDGEKLTVENFTASKGESLNADHLFLADGLQLQGSSYSDGDLHLLIGDGTGTIEVTLVGMEPAALDAFLHTGTEADTLNDQIQAIIDSGGHLA